MTILNHNYQWCKFLTQFSGEKICWLGKKFAVNILPQWGGEFLCTPIPLRGGGGGASYCIWEPTHPLQAKLLPQPPTLNLGVNGTSLVLRRILQISYPVFFLRCEKNSVTYKQIVTEMCSTAQCFPNTRSISWNSHVWKISYIRVLCLVKVLAPLFLSNFLPRPTIYQSCHP